MDLVCGICERKYKRLNQLSRHIQIFHEISRKNYYDRFYKREIEGICKNPACDNKTNFIGLSHGYYDYCSVGCNSSDQRVKFKKEQICLKKYNVKNPSQVEQFKKKSQNTCLKNLGVKNPSQSEVIKEKRKETMFDRYGVGSALQLDIFLEKFKETMMKKYNVKHALQLEEFLEKFRQSMLEKYGVENFSQTEEWINQMKNGQAAYMNSFIKNPSIPQVKTFENVKDLYEDAILNYQLGKYSLDIGIESIKLDIEYDGSRYHQDVEYDSRRDKEIKSQDWSVLRYRDYVPSKEQLIEDISHIIGE